MSGLDELYANARYLDDGGLAAELARVEHRLRYTWRAYARHEQIQPAAYSTWLIQAGVGGGKVESARRRAVNGPLRVQGTSR